MCSQLGLFQHKVKKDVALCMTLFRFVKYQQRSASDNITTLLFIQTLLRSGYADSDTDVETDMLENRTDTVTSAFCALIGLLNYINNQPKHLYKFDNKIIIRPLTILVYYN